MGGRRRLPFLFFSQDPGERMTTNDPKLEPKEPEPLTREELKFVSAYRQYRYGGDGIYKAAEKARIPKNRAVRTFNKPAVQEEIDRQDEAVRLERARQEVKDDELTVAFANRELMKTVKELTGTERLEALRLVYVVTGKIQMGNNRILDTAPAGGGEEGEGAPERFDYRAFIKVEQAAVPIVPVVAERQPAADSLHPTVAPAAGGQGTWNRDQGSVAPPSAALRAAVKALTTRNDEAKITPSVISKVATPKTTTEREARPPVRPAPPIRVG